MLSLVVLAAPVSIWSIQVETLRGVSEEDEAFTKKISSTAEEPVQTSCPGMYFSCSRSGINAGSDTYFHPSSLVVLCMEDMPKKT